MLIRTQRLSDDLLLGLWRLPADTPRGAKRQQERASHQRQIREQRKTGAKLHENVALRRENETPARIAAPELP